jgi:hypothetical protein
MMHKLHSLHFRATCAAGLLAGLIGWTALHFVTGSPPEPVWAALDGRWNDTYVEQRPQDVNLAASPSVSLTLFSSELDWIGSPDTLVYATVLNDGVAVARAYQQVSDGNGRAHLRLSTAREYVGPPRNAGSLYPSDKVIIVAAGQSAMTVTLPTVAADLDAAGDRIGGEAPLGSQVQVTLGDAANGKERRRAGCRPQVFGQGTSGVHRCPR